MKIARSAPVAGLRSRAERLDELGTLLGAGMDTDRALDAIGVGRRTGPVVGHLAGRGLLEPHEVPLVRALLEAGRLDAGIRLVAGRLRGRARLSRRLQTRMMLPAAVWVLAILVAPLPGLIGGDLGAGGYLGAILGPAALTAVAVWAAVRFWRPFVEAVRDLQLRSGRPPGLVLRTDLFTGLGHLLGAGLDAGRALGTLAEAERGAWRRRLESASMAVAGGAGVAPSLLRNGLAERRRDGPVLRAAEAAGRLPESLRHHAGLLGQALELRHETIAEWLPRIVYFLILIHLARGFF
ncbi:MAG: hypothetical protein EA347_08955 [Thioalkalivibrio sp.]|nr:MAG: hypothetical protein EA347_08955 [Thioalkalivibrio sp.]